ncbi:MAG: ADOP family duplicated permease, partial [Vicinamibacterales bacterium]
ALPVDRPERLALLMSIPSGARPGLSAWSNPVWEQIRERRHELFQTAFAYSARPARFNLASGGQTEFVDGQFVSGDYFEALGVRPVLGRALTSADDARGGGPTGAVADISHAFWQRRYGGAADVVGRTQLIDHVPFTIAGVLPPGFFGVDVGTTFDVAVPLGTEPLIRGRDSFLDRSTTSWLAVVVRLKDGQTLSATQEAVRALQPHLRDATMPEEFSAESKARYLTAPIAVESAAIGSSRMRGRYRQPVLTILTVVALVLLVACANIANLLLARTAARRQEFNVRVALGASRWHLARLLLAESLLLSGVSALLGLGIALWGSRLLVRQMSTFTNTVFLDVQLDWRVLAFTTAVATIAALLFGMAPALRASRAEPIGAIRDHAHGPAGGRRGGVSEALVVGQVAVSLILVVAAGLFARTFSSLMTRDLGFDRDVVLIAQLDLRTSAASPADRGALYERLADSAGAIAGVARAAVSEITPVSGSLTDTVVDIEGGPSMTMPQNISYRNVITPGWFATYGTDVLEGRDFDARDRPGSPLVTMVNQTFVRRFLHNGTPLGRRIRQGQPGRQGPWLEVVGVVEDAAYRSVRDPVPPTLYVPLAHVKEPPSNMSLSVRSTSGLPARLPQALADAISRLDRNAAVTLTPLKQQIDSALVQERILALIAGFSGVLALFLAGLGLYGIVWYAVSRRRSEIGIRMALGATQASVAGLVLFRTSFLVATGIAVGAVACWWMSRSIASLLYGVKPRDVATMASAAGILVIIGLVAAWMPARRASRIDPVEALRNL